MPHHDLTSSIPAKTLAGMDEAIRLAATSDPTIITFEEPNMENEIFREEALELLDDIEDTLLLLRKDLDNSELVNRIFRAMHTIKGSGAMFGFDAVADFAHKVENTIDGIRKGEARLNEEYLDLFLSARDQIRAILDATDQADPTILDESRRIVEELARVAASQADATAQTLQPATVPPPPSPAPPEPQAALAPAAARPTHGALASLDLPRLKTLIVEDEFVSRYLLQEWLHPLGTCHVAVNGFEAVLAFKNALVEKAPYDLVCLDIMMPGMSGTEVAKEMRRLEENIRTTEHRGIIIMTTAIDDQPLILEMLQRGLCDGYLAKPIARNGLFELIHSLVGNKSKS